MSEKPPRRKKKEEKTPEPEHNPALERLIEQAPKGSVPEIKQEIQPEQLGKRIVGGDDAWIKEGLDKIDTLNFRPGLPPEEIFNETPSTKETVSSNQLDTVLAKIAAEKKLTGAMFLNYLNDIGGKSASPEAVEKIMTVASQRLDKDVFTKLQTIVSEARGSQPEVSKAASPVESKQVEVEALSVASNIPPEVFNTFVHTGEASDRVLEGIAGKIIKKEDLSLEEIAIYREDTEKIEGILRKAESELSKENIVAANPEIQETAPENLPGRSPEELKDFATTFLAGEEGENSKLSQEPMTGLPGRDKDGNFNSSLIRQAIKANQSVGVRIRRNSGDVEDGWFLMDGDDSYVVAGKYVGKGRTITEIVPLQEVNDLNRIESHPQSVFTDAQKERLSGEFGEPPEGTPKEWREKLREMFVRAKIVEGTGARKAREEREREQRERELLTPEKTSEGSGEHQERGESLKEYLKETSDALQETAKEYGPSIVGAIGSVVERYNKLNWKTKLAVTGALMLGTAYMPVAAGVFTAALYGQRVLGAIGMGINKRKKLDAKIAANPEHWLAGKSELEKNAYVALLSAGYMAATSFAVHEGVEGVKAAANSDWLPNSVDWAKTTAQEGFEKVKESVNTDWLGKMLEHDSIQPSSDALETLVPTPDMSSVEVSPDQAHTVQTLDPTLFAEAKGTDQLRILAENSISKHLTPNEWTVLNNHIASLTSQERSIFDKFVADSSAKIDATSDFVATAPESASVPDSGLAEAEASTRDHLKDLNDQWNKLYEERDQVHQDIATAQAEGSDNAVQELSGAEARIDAQMHDIKQVYESAGSNTPFGRNPIDGHPMSEMEAQKLSELQNAMRDPRQTGAWPPGPPEEKGFFEKLFGGEDQDTVSSNDSESISKAPESSISSPESPSVGEHLIINEHGIEIPTAVPNIYADAEGHLFAHGGSIEEKIETIQKFLTENPDKVIYGTDDSGKYRIPWSLYEGHALPGEPVRTGGFLGFGSSFMDAPKPEEFVKKIK